MLDINQDNLGFNLEQRIRSSTGISVGTAQDAMFTTVFTMQKVLPLDHDGGTGDTAPIPLSAAGWLLLDGLGALTAFGRFRTRATA